jgi:glycosidase
VGFKADAPSKVSERGIYQCVLLGEGLAITSGRRAVSIKGESMNWWQKGIIYQIYPRSFQDSNEDGVGDIRGIIHRLPYLVELGIDAIWLSPIFTSPMADFGYDIADYTDVDPLFGSLADLDDLIDAVHRNQLKLILDFVPNHTSDQHPWFFGSRASRDHPKRDWYIWRDPAPDGKPPNNWLSALGEARGNSMRTLCNTIITRFCLPSPT